MRGYKREYDSPYYVHKKKHSCIRCGSTLAVETISKVVNSSSPEAKEFDFMSYDVGLKGDVEFIWDEFKCENCGFTSSIRNMKRIEKLIGEMEKRKKLKKNYFKYLLEEDEEYVFAKDHFCPVCNCVLKLDVSDMDTESKETNASNSRNRMIEFLCCKCNANYKLSEIKRLEEAGETKEPYVKDAMNTKIPAFVVVIVIVLIAFIVSFLLLK